VTGWKLDALLALAALLIVTATLLLAARGAR
jgi:hypothetical protein